MTRGRRGSLPLRRRALPSPPPCRFIPALSQDRTQALLQNHWKLAWTTAGNLPDSRQPHRQHHHRNRTHGTRRPRPQPLPHRNQADRPAERIHTHHTARVPRRLELYDPTSTRIVSFIPAPWPSLGPFARRDAASARPDARYSPHNHRSARVLIEAGLIHRPARGNDRPVEAAG